MSKSSDERKDGAVKLGRADCNGFIVRKIMSNNLRW